MTLKNGLQSINSRHAIPLFSKMLKNIRKITIHFTCLIKNHRTSILDKKSKLMKNNFIFMGIYLTEENVIMNTKCIVPWNKKKKQQSEI